MEEITGSANEAATRCLQISKKSAFLFFSRFTVSVTLSINKSESSSYFMILIRSFIPSFETNKVDPFHALTAPYPHFLKLNFLLIQAFTNAYLYL